MLVRLQIVLFTLIFSACNISNENKLLLDGSWSLEKVKGKKIDLRLFEKTPELIFSLKVKSLSGNDGCNNFTSSIKEINDNKLSFTPFVNTMMMCPNMENSDSINKLLKNVKAYKIEKSTLLFFNDRGEQILTYMKKKNVVSKNLSKNTTDSHQLKPNEFIYWINSRKVDCTGVSPMKCLEIQKNKNSNKWELFYDNINGFDFEEGYLYKIVVKEIKKTTKNLPADASSIEYELVKIIEKKIDNKLKLHDIWALETVNGNKINPKDFMKHPQLEINLTKNKIFGNDGCNNFSGGIKKINNNVLQFTALLSTRMSCPKMELSNEISNCLKQVNTYKLENLKLSFYNSKGKELLKFRKVD